MAQDDAQARRARLQALKAKHQQLDQAPESPEILEPSLLKSPEPPPFAEDDAQDQRGMRAGSGLFRNRRMGGGGDAQAALERFPRLREMLAQRAQQGGGRGGRFRATLDGEAGKPAPAAPSLPQPEPPTVDDDIAMAGESSPPFSTFSPEMLRRYRAQLEKRITWLEEALDKGLKELELIDKLQKR
ncbi:MAG TPA: hypothetical protein P5102_10435 [Candidatus Competibacteraceae bacterium]|nr:hypothetical protein [Candidatus Competibacteraceae bacterium]HRZ06548.1 hypothetical protein [Candidatus Competibacteraceae bacterium]HSA45284.1 hypothetical protein [Candidatus Competibacteraceae bacterium]